MTLVKITMTRIESVTAARANVIADSPYDITNEKCINSGTMGSVATTVTQNQNLHVGVQSTVDRAFGDEFPRRGEW